MGPAKESQLGDLHSKVAKVMTNALDAVIRDQENPNEDENGNVIERELNPALLSVMVRFLDANKITCAPEQGNAMSDLEKKLQEKSEKRRLRVGNVVQLHED